MTKMTNVYYISLPPQNPNKIPLHHLNENSILQKFNTQCMYMYIYIYIYTYTHTYMCMSPYLHHIQFCFSPLTIRNHVRRRGILVSHIYITLSVL